MSIIFKKAILPFLLIFFVFAAISFAQEAIQTQESDTWDGIEVDLISCTVKNNIVTVKCKLRNVGSEKHSVRIEYRSSYLMDEVNQKKYFALKDSDGIYIAGPMADKGDGGRFWFDIFPEKYRSLWIKFPKPTDSPETITVSIPGVFPFEEVELK
ncbi:MAG TPA: hypothetical protein VMW92_03225 [Candidatus Heimdallarchaeota archaeon]|jgi:hypothetical protein|nr:hypothetical protein [Candidatus Heimdallarchaeota archaeon]